MSEVNNCLSIVRDTSPRCPTYQVKIIAVELVGSRGQGTQLPDSDIDVVLLLELEGGDMDEMKQEFFSFGHKDFVKFNSTSKGRPVENTGGFAKKNEISAIHYTEESHHIVRNSSCVSIMLALQPVKQ